MVEVLVTLLHNMRISVLTVAPVVDLIWANVIALNDIIIDLKVLTLLVNSDHSLVSVCVKIQELQEISNVNSIQIMWKNSLSRMYMQ